MKKILFLYFLSILFIGCIKEKIKPMPFGKDFNLEREKVGLQKVDKNFENSTFNKYKNFDKLKFVRIDRIVKGINLFEGIKSPSYIEKITYFNPNEKKIYFEEDIYASGLKKPDIDLNIDELLICRYIFEKYDKKINVQIPYQFNNSIYNNQKPFDKEWQYIHIYPVPIENKSKGIQFYTQKLEYISKQKADSILNKWNINRQQKKPPIGGFLLLNSWRCFSRSFTPTTIP